MTGKPLPPPASVSVSVLNGTGVYNQATDTGTALTALGYHVVGLGDTSPVGDVSETYVYYGSRDSATEAAAESVVRSMSGAVVMAYDPAEVVDGAQVTVVTGSQFAVNAPALADVNARHGHRRLDVIEHDDVDDLRAGRIGLGRRCDCRAEFSHHQSRAVGPASMRARRGSRCTDPQSDLSNAPRRADSKHRLPPISGGRRVPSRRLLGCPDCR